MSITKSKYVSAVYERFRQKPFAARAAAEQRRAEIHRQYPRIRQIDEELSSIGLQVFAETQNGGEDLPLRLARIGERTAALQKQKADLLESFGYARDYTGVRYECPHCSDSGYVGIKMCACMKKDLIKAAYQSSGIGRYLEQMTFDSFRPDYYSKKKNEKTGLSPFEVMSCIYEDCRYYARDFQIGDGVYPSSLLFMGATGLGKTHLSASIAREVIEKGYSVCYESAQNILSAYEKKRFQSEATADTDPYLENDLLIIDDLGTEIQGKTSISYIYTLINTRLIAAKPMIISTNLTPEKLRLSYEDRVVSRLFGEFEVMLFEGEDLRNAVRNKG